MSVNPLTSNNPIEDVHNIAMLYKKINGLLENKKKHLVNILNNKKNIVLFIDHISEAEKQHSIKAIKKREPQKIPKPDTNSQMR